MFSTLRTLQKAALPLAFCVACANPAAASPIGSLDVQSGGLTLSNVAIDFTSVSSTGVFAPTTLATTGDLSFAAPTNANFITFAALPGTTITSTSIAPGVYSSASCGSAPAPGQTCTLPGSGLNYVNTTTGSVVTFTVQGSYMSPTGAPVPITGIYTLQFETNYQTVLATLLGGGSVSTSYSAEFLSSASTADRLRISGSVNLSSTGLDFSATATSGSSTIGGSNAFLVSSTSDGAFAPLSGTFGTADDLNSAIAPVNVPFNLLDFLEFAADPNLDGSLTFLPQGAFSSAQCGAAPAQGQTCTIGISPFMLANVAGGSIATFDLRGIFSQPGNTAPYEGTVSLQFAGLSYQQVLATISAGGSVTGIYSASFDTGPAAVVPEPATLALLGFGLAAIGFARRRQHSIH